MPNLIWKLLLAFYLGSGVALAQEPLPPPVAVPGGETRLDDIGLYSVTYRFDDGHTGAMPLGWTGPFDATTGVACLPAGTQNGREAFLLHPPWRGGTGRTDQTFRLTLPRASKITLALAVAMQAGATDPGKSDGAAFRVFLNDKTLLDRLKTDSQWSASRFDLTSQAGRTVTLRFETDPGPARNPSFDYALWGDRLLTVTGAVASPSSLFPPPAWSGLTPAVSSWGGVSPTFLRASTGHQPRMQADPQAKDLLDGWALSFPGASASLGLAHGAFLELVGPDGQIVHSDAPEVQKKLTQETVAPGHLRRRISYMVGTRSLTVTADLYAPRGGCARAEVSSYDPYLAAVHFGDIGPVAFRRNVIVPYLGTIAFLPDLGLFAHVFVDHTRSEASDLDGATAHYLPLTDGRRNTVRETAYFAVSPDFHAVLPTPANPPSPYRALLGDKVVLDVWGGAFADNAARLREYSSYGMTHFLTIAHVWQHGGYDSQLPDVLPALADMGGDMGMSEWAKAGTSDGNLFALHENYVDFYPDAPSYDEQDVSRDSDNHLVPAWKNKVQSYAVAPTAILKYARKFTPDVHARFGTNAGYLDVHSAVPPWFHVDFRADQPGAGKFQTVRDAHRDLWALFRQTHGGPVLGEGANHWYWSGLLDGVEAQFGVGVPSNGGEEAPLFVDFDLLKIHPLQFNHGMGYLERWYRAGRQADWAEGFPPEKTLDQYRMQEIAYGHAGFAASILWGSLPFVWQEYGLVRPVTRAYAAAQAVAIDYDVNGHLLGTNAALAAGGTFDRVRVRYNSGLTVWANSRGQDWALGNGPNAVTLPPFGWLARGPGLTAWTARCDGLIADYAETPDSLFADARTAVPGPAPRLRVTPSVEKFTQTGPRQFQITFRWGVGEPVPAGFAPFVHVTGKGTDQAENIVFQIPVGIASTPDQWSAGPTATLGGPVPITLPDALRDGKYAIKVGLYQPQTGERLRLSGPDDGGRRIIVGTLTVADGGQTLRWNTPLPILPTGVSADGYTNPAHRTVHFGKIATDGSVSLERLSPGAWRLTPFPRDRPFFVSLNAAQIDPLLRSLRVEAEDVAGHVIRALPLTFPPLRPGWTRFQVNTVPGALFYRLTGEKL